MSIADLFVKWSTRPEPLRTVFFRNLFRRWPIGSYETRLRGGAVVRPNYAWCVYFAALEAKALGHQAITVAEFGVAGGNGLVCLCDHKIEIEKMLGIEILVVGFDSASGLPATGDARDILYAWPPGSFVMDRAALERRMGGRAQLVLGDVGDTVSSWQPESRAPLGAVMFDLDYYTSTINALRVLTKENVLPRVWCYFDDVCAGPEEAITARVGEREAISDFNHSPERAGLRDHIGLSYAFKGVMPQPWHQHIYVYHRLGHPQYSTCITAHRDQLQLA